jgi:uncharacterized protein
MGKGILLFIVTFVFTFTAHAKDRITLDDVECIEAATSGPRGEFTADQIRLILQSIENYWKQEFKKRGAEFQEIRYRVYNGRTNSGCGQITRDHGPLYCSADSTVYVDPAWFRQARGALGIETQTLLTFVLAHEVGHHIQFQLGIPQRVHGWLQAQYGVAAANRISMNEPMEFQADCLGAVYLHTLHDLKILSDQDIREAAVRMLMLGDDAAQYRRARESLHNPWAMQRLKGAHGYEHGSSADRQKWFIKGFKGGALEVCEPYPIKTLD